MHEDPPRLPDDHPMAGLLSVMMNRDAEQRWPMPRVRDELGRHGAWPALHGRAGTRRAAARPEQTGVAAAGAPAPAPPPRSRPATGSAGAWIAAAAVLAVAAVVRGVRLGRARHPRGAPDDGTTPRRSRRRRPSPSRAPAPASTAEDTREQMDAFITSYLATVTTDPRAAFEQLTPEFQEASGGYEGYIGWWSKVRVGASCRGRQRPVAT